VAQRNIDGWLAGHAQFTENSESPRSYHRWAGISCIAAALQRKVWMQWGHSTIYPNMYVVLIGPSGSARKGEPIEIARDLISELTITTTGEDNTREAVIRKMSHSHAPFVDNRGSEHFQCAISCFIEELSVFTGYQNTTFMADLTQWYDSRDRWTRITKHQGTDELTGVCFNLLSATAPDWLPHILTREAIGGGFTSRIIFVSEPGKEKVIANPNEFPIDEELRHDLIHDLEIIHTIAGEMHFSKDALEWYENWYIGEEENIKSSQLPLLDPIFGGYISRRATHLKKIAMCMSMSDDGELTVELRHLEEALDTLVDAESRMGNVFAKVGMSRYVVESQLITGYLKSNGGALRSEILKDLRRDVDVEGLEHVIKGLVFMRTLKTERLANGDVRYIYGEV